MRTLIVVLMCLPMAALAQPGSGTAGSGGSAAGSANAGSANGSADAGSGTTTPPPAPAPLEGEPKYLAELKQEITKKLAEAKPEEKAELEKWLKELETAEQTIGSLRRRATELKQPELQTYLDEAATSLRKVCVAAISADGIDTKKPFADQVIKVAEVKLKDRVDIEQICKDRVTLKTHEAAQTDVATNERHVIMAYAAMWLVAVGFVLFLWRRQQALKLEIAQLRRDLDAAAKDGK
jgi:hypothetical protein